MHPAPPPPLTEPDPSASSAWAARPDPAPPASERPTSTATAACRCAMVRHAGPEAVGSARAPPQHPPLSCGQPAGGKSGQCVEGMRAPISRTRRSASPAAVPPSCAIVRSTRSRSCASSRVSRRRGLPPRPRPASSSAGATDISTVTCRGCRRCPAHGRLRPPRPRRDRLRTRGARHEAASSRRRRPSLKSTDGSRWKSGARQSGDGVRRCGRLLPNG